MQKYPGPEIKKIFRYAWNRALGIPARLLMRIMARKEPQQEYDGIRLIVTDVYLRASAERFFERTRGALIKAASAAPRAYAQFRRDVQQVFLWGQTNASPYNPFQLAVVVSPQIALEADTVSYAAWLLHISGLPHDENEAQARSGELLRSLEPEERISVLSWLTSLTERGPP